MVAHAITPPPGSGGALLRYAHFSMMTTIDWKALVCGKTDGFTTAVFGARVGDPFASLPQSRITQLEPMTPSVRRSWGSRGVFEIAEDGSEVAVPREVLFAELQKHGGRAYAERVTYELSDGKIRKIWVRGAPLKGLPFSVETDIERLLGPSIGVQRSLGWAIHHFPERGLSVAWHIKEGHIEHVALGPVEWTPPIFSAKDVLSEWLAAERAGLGPRWNEPQDHASSAWVRYARVMALLRAFDLGSPRSFADGEFLEDRPIVAYPRAAKAIEARTLRRAGRPFAARSDTLSRLFWWLLLYRGEAERLLRKNSGWLEAGHPGILTALYVTGAANAGVAAALAEVDALLLEMISPEDEQISEREMFERWGYPAVDLDQILQDEL